MKTYLYSWDDRQRKRVRSLLLVASRQERRPHRCLNSSVRLLRLRSRGYWCGDRISLVDRCLHLCMKGVGHGVQMIRWGRLVRWEAPIEIAWCRGLRRTYCLVLVSLESEDGGWLEYHSLYCWFHCAFQPSGTLGGGGPEGGRKSDMLIVCRDCGVY